MKKYLIFDLDWTLIKSNKETWNLIINYVGKNYWVDKEEFKYFLQQTKGMPLKKQIQNFMKTDEKESRKITNKIYELIRIENKSIFFPWSIEKIKELSKNYKLFLSTWNSTEFAKKKLNEANIIKFFEYILWSETILKWPEHIDFFKEKIWDENFEKYTIIIWDWQIDREIAKNSNIDFIHIDENLKNSFNDKYEIKSVRNIDRVLEKINLQY